MTDMLKTPLKTVSETIRTTPHSLRGFTNIEVNADGSFDDAKREFERNSTRHSRPVKDTPTLASEYTKPKAFYEKTNKASDAFHLRNAK